MGLNTFAKVANSGGLGFPSKIIFLSPDTELHIDWDILKAAFDAFLVMNAARSVVICRWIGFEVVADISQASKLL
jgi:hypothetical protein